MSEAIPASMIPSAHPLVELSCPERSDPYWDENWVPGSQAVWSSADTGREFTKSKKNLSMTREDALSYVTGTRKRGTTLALAGLLDSWATVTAEQAAAFCGDKAILNPYAASPGALFSLRTMDVGRYPAAVADKTTGNPGWLYRRSSSAQFDRLVKDELTYNEWVSVTGGLPFSSSPVFDRHNTLAAELCLRASEYLSVGAVMGEKFCEANLLVGASGYTHRADGLIVREDGLRIAVEVTASKSPTLPGKVRRWAKLLSERAMDESGLMVLFVVAPHRGASNGAASQVRSTISSVLREFPGRSKDSPGARIGVVEWTDWFPGKHLLSDDFLQMRAKFPVGPAGDGRWLPVDLASYSFDPADSFDATAVLRNASVLSASPFWLRQSASNVIGTPLDRAGGELPRLAYSRPERSWFSQNPRQGVVAKPSDRLLSA